MSAADLLREVQAQGVTAFVRGDRLVLEPASKLAPGMIETLREHKAEILEYLGSGIGTARPPEPHRRCPSCRGGLQPADEDRAFCGSCRWSMEHLAPRRPQ